MALSTPYQTKKKRRQRNFVFLRNVLLLRIGNQLPIPVRREHVSPDIQSARIDTPKSWPCEHLDLGMRRLPGVSVSLPERFRTGRKKASLLCNDDENDQVVSTPMPPMYSQDGSKDARMVYRSTGRSKRRDTLERIDRYIGSWSRCARINGSFKRE